MNKFIFYILFLGLLITPAITWAHMSGGESAGEGALVTTEEFEEIEDTMIKMMNGQELSEEEAEAMWSFMQEHHGLGNGFGPEMMMGNNFPAYGYGRHMMGWGGMSSFGYWLMIGSGLVWLLAGLLLVVWLIKKINKNDK